MVPGQGFGPRGQSQEEGVRALLTSYTADCMGDGTPGQGRRQKSPCAKTRRSPCLAGVAGRLFTPDFLLLEHSSLALLCYVDLLSPQGYQTLLKQDIHICLLQNPVQKQWELLRFNPAIAKALLLEDLAIKRQMTSTRI